MSLRLQLLGYLTKRGYWINGGELERLQFDKMYKMSNASRRMRELYHDGLIERKIENGSVWYRAKSHSRVENTPIKQEQTQEQLFDLPAPHFRGH